MLLRNSVEGKFVMTLDGLLIFLEKSSTVIRFQADFTWRIVT